MSSTLSRYRHPPTQLMLPRSQVYIGKARLANHMTDRNTKERLLRVVLMVKPWAASGIVTSGVPGLGSNDGLQTLMACIV